MKDRYRVVQILGGTAAVLRTPASGDNPPCIRIVVCLSDFLEPEALAALPAVCTIKRDIYNEGPEVPDHLWEDIASEGSVRAIVTDALKNLVDPEFSGEQALPIQTTPTGQYIHTAPTTRQ